MASEPRPGPRSGLREFCLDDGKPELESYSQTSLFFRFAHAIIVILYHA